MRVWLRCFGIASSLAFATSLAAPARAQSASELDALLGQSIVSTPSKGSETDTTAPATSTVITAEQLRSHGIRSLDEAINYLSLGMSTSTSLHTAEIGARGVQMTGDYGNHVLLLLDGHALNEPWNGTGYFERGAGVPFEMIDHIEVILGPGSVLYGSQAMLGVINIVTKRAKDFSGVRLFAEGEAVMPTGRDSKLRSPGGSGYFGDLGGGYRVGAGYGRELEVGETASEVTLALDYYWNKGPTWQLGPQYYGEDWVSGEPKNFGPRAPRGVWGGPLQDADYMEVPAAYLRYRLGDFQAAVRASAYRRSTAFPDYISGDTAEFDEPRNREIDRFLNVELTQRIPVSSRVELTLRGYTDLYDYEWFNRASSLEDCPETFVNGCARYLNGVGRAFGGELRARIDWPLARASTLLGVHGKVGIVEDALHIREIYGPGSQAPIGDQRDDGVIAPYIAQALSPTHWLDLNLGLRLDHDTRFGQALSPRTAAGVTPWQGGRLKVIYAEAFRGPSAYELTYHDPGSQIAAGDLEAERVRSLEGSVEQRFGKHRLLFGVFRSWWSELVGSIRLSDEETAAAVARGELTAGVEEGYRRENVSRITNHGLNAAYEGAALDGRLRFGLNLTAAHTLVNAGDGSAPRPISVAPQTFGNARVAYELAPSLPTFGAALRFADRRLPERLYDGGFTRVPSAPPLAAVRLAITGPFVPVPGLSYRAGGEYSFAAKEPYVIGAHLYAKDETTPAELAPTRRMHVFMGLEYAFDH